MDNPLFLKYLIATPPRRIHECQTVSEAPDNCAKMPKSIQLRAFGGTGEPFGCLDSRRMGQRAFSSLPGGGEVSAWTERLRAALWKHCQKEQFKAEGLFRLVKDINIWIAIHKKLSPGSNNGGERPRGTSIKALETLRDSVINPPPTLGGPEGPTGKSWPEGDTIGRGGKALGPEGLEDTSSQGPRETSPALRNKCRRPEMALQFPHTSLPRGPRTHEVSRALWAVGPSDASLALRGLPQKDRDILVQEVIRTVLETVYEPYFLSCSHGFRPGRSQHTCSKQIRRDFVGTVWFMEGRTSQCFNGINKQVLLGLMRRRIRDDRFLNLVQKELETSLGAGAGGATKAKGVGPLLCNIVLHEPDLSVMRLKRIVDGGRRRGAVNPESKELWRQSAAFIDRTTAHRARALRASGPFDLDLGPPQENRRQINYVRFADDYPIGIIGPRALAERIRCLVTRFPEVRLKLGLHLRRTRKPLQYRPNTLHYVPMGPKAGDGFAISAHGGKREERISCITKNKKIPSPGYLISRDSRHTYNFVRRGRRYRIRRSGGLSSPVDMRKVINRLAEKGFRDKSGHPKPNFAYFQYPQSYSVARIASIPRGLANYYHLANPKRRCVTRLSYILRTSSAKTYAAKSKPGTAARIFAKGGRDLSKPIKAKKGRRPLLNGVLESKTIAHRRRGAGSEGHFPAIPYTRHGQIKLPDTKPLTRNWQPGQARLNCIAKINRCCHREGNDA
uniref:Reverse transcriptase n=1 Tax=Haplomitrium hookeri TaxID=37406 RepID=A0A4Y5WYI6_HAPHO|nr:reverse transcriptase [Haplomitrium hookeri]QDE12928.1 reverse transcriptase [Haplomitrium hookeri]